MANTKNNLNPPEPTKTEKAVKRINKLQSFNARINDWLYNLQRIPAAQKIFFVQHLAVMVKSGITLDQALKTLAEQSENKRFKKVLRDIAEKVNRGEPLADALAAYPRVFNELFVNMIRSGEISGKLESVLQQLYVQIKKEHNLIAKVKGALTYPAVIVLAMLVIGTLMIIFILPKITALFTDLEADLPLATRALIGFSNIISSYGIFVLIGVIAFIIILVQIWRTEQGKYFFHKVLLMSPIIGSIIKKINLARFSRTFSSLLGTDIPIIQSVNITSRVLRNIYYKDALKTTAVKIQKGATISSLIKNYPSLFPPLVTQMVEVGEQTGNLDNILLELAGFYEEDVDRIMNNLPSIIEPVLIILLGGAVAALAVAVIMPMYNLSQVI